METTVENSRMDHPNIVSHAEWIAARTELLNKEKEFTRLRDELSRQRRELPWEKVKKEYVFDGPTGKETLADLFDGSIPHLGARDARLVVGSRAPLDQIGAFKMRMGWRFKWVSSFANDFNRDYNVSFSKEEMANGQMYYNYAMQEFPSEEGPGASAFYKDEDGNIFHTYSTFGRGLDIFLGAYNWLDIAPKGRDEDGLAYSMAWVKHHDKYVDGQAADPLKTYAQPKSSDAKCCSAEND